MSDNIELYASRCETIEQAALTAFEAIAGRRDESYAAHLVPILLRKFPGLISRRDEQGRNLAEAAVLEGKVDVLRFLILEHPLFLFDGTLLDLARTANHPLCNDLVQQRRNHYGLNTASFTRNRQSAERTGQENQWGMFLGVMCCFAAATFAVPFGFHNIYPLPSSKPVKTVNLSIRELFTFPAATAEGFFLLTTTTAVFFMSLLMILYALCSICKKWTAFSFLIIALAFLTFFAMMDKVVPNFVTVGGGHVKVRGAFVVVFYSIYVMLLLILLYYSMNYLLNKVSALYNVQRSARRLDLELGGERQMSMVRAPRNESGRVHHNMSTNESISEQNNSSTDLASENDSSRVQSHTSTATAPENESGGSAIPGPSNESSRVQHHMNTATASENDMVEHILTTARSLPRQRSRLECYST